MIDKKYYKSAAERLNYNPRTGIFTLVKSRFKSKIGKPAGSIVNNGYLRFSEKVDGKRCEILLHRLAWYVTYGYMPDTIDHINYDRSDNRIENLRDCSLADNVRNARPMGGTSKFKGVSLHAGKWRARIYTDVEQKYLGRFKTEEEAAKAYNEAAIKYHGEFAYLNKFPIDNKIS